MPPAGWRKLLYRPREIICRMAVEEVFVVGTSQSVAPVAVREKLHVDLEEVYRAPGELLVNRGILQEALPLSTCGRLELYGVTKNPERALKLLVRLLAERAGLDREQVRSHIYALRGVTAVRHLFRVASGLESVVHGETGWLCEPTADAFALAFSEVRRLNEAGELAARGAAPHKEGAVLAHRRAVQVPGSSSHHLQPSNLAPSLL